MAISQDQQTSMRQAAASPSQAPSLADMFQQQYDRLYKTQQAQDAYTPQAQENIRAIGDISDRAAGEAPVGILEQGLGVSEQVGKIKEGTTSTILSVLSEMAGLKQQEEEMALKKSADARAEEELKLKKMQLQQETGWVIDETTSEPRPMTKEEKEKTLLEGLDDVTASYLQLFQRGAMKKVSEIPAADRSKVVQALAAAGVNPEAIAKQKEGGDVEGVIKSLYDLYAVNNDLSKGRVGGVIATIQGMVGKNAPAKRYEELKNGVLSAIRSFVGEKGIMTEPDAQRIVDLLPKVTSTDEEAILAWQQINDFFKSKYGYDVIKDMSQEQTSTIKMSNGKETYEVPAENVSKFEEAGYKRI